MKLFYIIGFFAVVVGVVFFIAPQFTKTNGPISPDTIMQKPETTTQEQTVSEAPQTSIASSRYVDYTPQNLEAFKDKKRIIYFHANWCPVCKPLDEEFKNRLNEIPQDVVILKANYNDTEEDDFDKAAKNKYAVTYQHSFVQIDADGSEITKWNGGGLDELIKRVK